jgi:hypothetical protein
MPLYPPRSLEPYKKNETLHKREQQLRHALSAAAAPERLRRTAENVRIAQLAVLKAEKELVRYDKDSEERSRRLASIELRQHVWQSTTIESIIQQYSAAIE